MNYEILSLRTAKQLRQQEIILKDIINGLLKFEEELEHNQKTNQDKGLENRVDIDYVLERVKDIRGGNCEFK